MTVLLSAPIQGWVSPLDDVDDLVFAQRLAGDGVAIDPTGSTVFAPCDAQVVSVAATRHAVTLRGSYGVEILIHVGLETVALKGEGFMAHVSAGNAVQTGDRLISFDMDKVGRRAKSLITPVLITNPDAFQVRWRQEDRDANVGDPLLQAWAIVRAKGPDPMEPQSERRVVLRLEEGLHARPAARVGSLVQPYSAEVHLEVRGRRANAKNLISLMTLQAAEGDEIRLLATGRDRDRALTALAAYLEETRSSPETARFKGAPPLTHPGPDGRVRRGVPAAPGQVIGPAFQLKRRPKVLLSPSQGQTFEARALEAALERVRVDLTALTAADVGGEVMAAHLHLLNDPDLRSAADGLIEDGESAGGAWSSAVAAQVFRLEALDQPHLRARSSDLMDLRRQVLSRLTGEDPASGASGVPAGAILLADDLLPSELLGLKDLILGICTAEGGATSHTAIIASSLNLPMVAAAGQDTLSIADGALVWLNGDQGELVLDPTQEERERVFEGQGSAKRAGGPSPAVAADPCRTKDGVRVEVVANLAGVDGAAEALALGAEGCGLLRTEFLFMDRSEPPGDDEQRAAYQAVLDALGGRPLTIRTFDFGGDKPCQFLPTAREDNPALGLRGVRTSLRRPDLLRSQLRAILRVSPAGACRILLPMVTSVGEAAAVGAILEEERRGLGAPTRPKLGVMIETPAAALATTALGAHAAFFSIGTNDLTQYTLAMDRTNAALAPGMDSLHPSVLRLMALACEGAARSGRPVGVCGSIASDPLAAAVLIGLGVRELSAAPAMIPTLKAKIHTLTVAACQTLAAQALALTSPGEVRALLAAPADAAAPETVV